MLELADIFCRYGEDYLKKHRYHLMPSQNRALHDIRLCRTDYFGGHVFRLCCKKYFSCHEIRFDTKNSVILELF